MNKPALRSPSVTSSARQSKRRQAVAAAARPVVAYGVERLEHRVLLAGQPVGTTVVVTSVSDSATLPNGLIDLRMAINMANAATGPTTITFDPTYFATKQVILPAVGLKSIYELTNTAYPTTIIGPSAGVSLDGSHTNGFRAFLIDQGVTATLVNFDISNFSANNPNNGATVSEGGAIMALADSVGAAATVINLPEDAKGTTTLESKTNFIGGAKEGSTLVATATPVHRGRRTQVWTTRLETEDGKLVAIVTQTQMVL